MFKTSRHAHRFLVPVATLPLLLTATTGVMYDLLEQWGLEADWLLVLHVGHFGPLNLQPVYSLLLGLCVLVLVITGLRMWFRTRPKASRS
jgi:uncharacterized iron-regulated membrane protein